MEMFSLLTPVQVAGAGKALVTQNAGVVDEDVDTAIVLNSCVDDLFTFLDRV